MQASSCTKSEVHGDNEGADLSKNTNHSDDSSAISGSSLSPTVHEYQSVDALERRTAAASTTPSSADSEAGRNLRDAVGGNPSTTLKSKEPRTELVHLQVDTNADHDVRLNHPSSNSRNTQERRGVSAVNKVSPLSPGGSDGCIVVPM